MQLLANIVIPPLATRYTYLIPNELQADITVGTQVEVEFGRSKRTGYVVEISDKQASNGKEAQYELKSLSSQNRFHLAFSPEQLLFFEWIAKYYGEPLAKVIQVAVPPYSPPKQENHVNFLKAPEVPLRGRVQMELMEYIRNNPIDLDCSVLLKRFRGCRPALQKLAQLGLIEILTTELLESHLLGQNAPSWAKKEVILNSEQSLALEEVKKSTTVGSFAPILLHGVTGSGKTEVYIEAIKEAASANLGSIVIVPEIALTPQLIDRFVARLGPCIAVLHSALSKSSRWSAWRALLEGRNTIAIGARSAIFAPVAKLGLVIVDEEHDSSYKQSESIRYHARDLAVVRSKMQNCPIILGSATPSLESLHNTIKQRYRLINLGTRHLTASTVSIECVNLNLVKPWQRPAPNISPELHMAINEVLCKDEQAFILYNRRGFATYLQCQECEEVLKCPNCSVALTYHKSQNALLCHYCNMQIIPPRYCSICQEKKPDQPPPEMVQRGAGTERVVDEVLSLFPGVEIERLDRDAASNPKQYREILDRMRQGSSQILVGTQMIAKGHDLPNVTLVGIVDCDVGLHMPDFRSPERVFQLLTQAAGRAGRGDRPGKVILQTYVPSHPALVKTAAKDYQGFAEIELKNRAVLNYPPFSKLLRIVSLSSDSTLAKVALDALKKNAITMINQHSLPITLLGPARAPLERIKGNWRWHILCKSKNAKALVQLNASLRSSVKNTTKQRFAFDLDPQDLL